jgi:hypothetical protein
MSIEVEVNLVVEHHRQIVGGNVDMVCIPFSEDRMMLDSGSPNDGRILGPVLQGSIDPIKHLITHGCVHSVPALNILQADHLSSMRHLLCEKSQLLQFVFMTLREK